MMAALSKSEMEQDKAMDALKSIYLVFAATAQMAMNGSLLSLEKKLNSGLIGTEGGEGVKEKDEGTS